MFNDILFIRYVYVISVVYYGIAYISVCDNCALWCKVGIVECGGG